MYPIPQVDRFHPLVFQVTVSDALCQVTVAFSLADDPETSLLAWTTTPYTLPSNLALCVHPEFTYVKIHDEAMNKNFILHENLLKAVYKDPKKAKYKKIAQFQGSAMKGWRYIPLFGYFEEKVTHSLNSILRMSRDGFSLKTRPSGSSWIPT
jgi:isoleucyl-tRNA synthetase